MSGKSKKEAAKSVRETTVITCPRSMVGRVIGRYVSCTRLQLISPVMFAVQYAWPSYELHNEAPWPSANVV